MKNDGSIEHLAQLFYAAKSRQEAVRDLLAPVERQLVLHLQREGERTIELGGGKRIKMVPGYGDSYSPSQRRKIRRDHPTALLHRGEQPPRLVIEDDAKKLSHMRMKALQET